MLIKVRNYLIRCYLPGGAQNKLASTDLVAYRYCLLLLIVASAYCLSLIGYHLSLLAACIHAIDVAVAITRRCQWSNFEALIPVYILNGFSLPSLAAAAKAKGRQQGHSSGAKKDNHKAQQRQNMAKRKAEEGSA